jgi:carbamoyltransferase
MSRVYIGLATTPHDPAIAIVDEQGKVLFAEGAERYLQNKRAWGSPPDDLIRMESLLREYCAKSREVVVCTSWTDAYSKRARFLFFSGLTRALIRRAFEKGDAMTNYFESRTIAGFMNPYPATNIELQNYRVAGDRPLVRRGYDHHLTHAAAACFSSGFEDAACAIVDGMGEGVATAFFKYKQGRLERLKGYPRSMASLGWFYEQLCAWCRFQSLKGEEWKVMGLAPYGKLDENIRALFLQLIKVEKGVLRLGKNVPQVKQRIEALVRDVNSSPLESANMAYTGQHVFGELLGNLLSQQRLGFSRNLVLGGGCALNSAWNGMLAERTPFKNSFVFCAPADDGNAVGAALLGCYEDNPSLRPPLEMQNPYLGTGVDASALKKLSKYSGVPSLEIGDAQQLCDHVANVLCQGKIVGWMQGRAEFGPRALGNRSILADPRSPTVKNRLNDHVKFREEFRPFAPSILHEYGPEYFENYCETPYMERALRFRKGVRGKVPGVVHVDGTGRLQTVRREWNPRYYDLIWAFLQKTGVPIILNTSFNVMGKPIVHTVEDAFATFATSGLDLLVVENRLFAKDPRLLEHLGSRSPAEEEMATDQRVRFLESR